MKLKKEKQALQMFCNEESYVEMYHAPFVNDKDNGRILATNGIVMIVVDPKYVRGKYMHFSQRLPDYDYRRNDIDKFIPFSVIEKAYNTFNLIPEKMSKDGQSADCPECDGHGTVEYEYRDRWGNLHYQQCTCPECEGSGKRADFELVETGRMILPDDSTFQLKDQIVSAEILWKVVTALRLMGFNSMRLKSQQNHGNLFEVCDGITVLIMSRLEIGENHRKIKL